MHEALPLNAAVCLFEITGYLDTPLHFDHFCCQELRPVLSRSILYFGTCKPGKMSNFCQTTLVRHFCQTKFVTQFCCLPNRNVKQLFTDTLIRQSLFKQVLSNNFCQTLLPDKFCQPVLLLVKQNCKITF